MKTFEEMGVKVPEILISKNIDTETWCVVACDQYTQDRNYWKNAEKIVGKNPSTLNIILPEVYLNDDDKPERIKKIQETMKNYLSDKTGGADGVFLPAEKEMIYVERKTHFGRTRRGLVLSVDLEKYEWKPFSNALIRATEATIKERIPPRMEIREGASLESPHIMLLVNDAEHSLVEGTGNQVRNNPPLYSGSLMQKSGSISGWKVQNANDLEYVRAALENLFEKNKDSDGSSFLFAVGDGNHSLATAKAVWEKYKTENPDKSKDENCPIRYALVEVVNIYDEGLTFEPIHRVLFNLDAENLIKNLEQKLNGKANVLDSEKELSNRVKNSSADFGFVFTKNRKENLVLLSTEIKELAVSKMQPALDEILKNAERLASEKRNTSENRMLPEIDYIHGEDEVFRLGKMENTVSILMPKVAKESFFATINKSGPLPRKSFSMGEASEKRFYLECRRLFD